MIKVTMIIIVMMAMMKKKVPGVLLVLNIAQCLTPVLGLALLLPSTDHVLNIPDMVKCDDIDD